MYKVMLVDDEKLILQGILSILEWDKLDLKVVHLAENGLEALEKFKKEPVDVVITDINMPSLTGLELLKELKEINTKVKFIILSGYDDFSYAKTAIKYGVENYILKPINEEELEEALIEIRDKLYEYKKKEESIFDKNRVLMRFLEGNLSKEDLEEFEEILNISFNDKHYIASNILIKKKEWKQVNDIINVIKDNTTEGYELIFKFNGDVILINSWSREESKEDIINYYEKINCKLKESIKEEIFIAIGDTVDELEKIKESYFSSNEIKKYVLTKGYGVCISKEDIIEIKEEARNFSKEIENLNKLILEKDTQMIQDYIENTFNDEKLNPENIYDLSIKILLLIDEISEEFKYGKNHIGDNLSNVIIELCNESDRENIKIFLLSNIYELTKVMNLNNIKYSPVVQQIVNYVNSNYYEELSLKTLSQKYNINSSYLGQIFNKEIGYSFSEYMNKIKNMKAKELILTTNMKINDIAKEVGYFDTSYFYRKFKKYYGVSPSTLREIKQY